LFSFTVAGNKITDLTEFPKFIPLALPLSWEMEIEGLSVQKLNGKMVIVWGHRGLGMQQGILYWGLLDLPNKKVTDVSPPQNVPGKFPWIVDANTRHIADLKVDADGVVWASATKDPGDTGPFASAIYSLGTLSVPKGSGKFELHLTGAQRQTFDRKVEAIEWVPGPNGGIAFGADDEDHGGWFYFK